MPVYFSLHVTCKVSFNNGLPPIGRVHHEDRRTEISTKVSNRKRTKDSKAPQLIDGSRRQANDISTVTTRLTSVDEVQ